MATSIPLVTLAEAKRCRFLPAAILLAFCGSLAVCQGPDPGDKLPPVCDHRDAVQIPPGDLPTAADHETLASCLKSDDGDEFPAASTDLYFGIRQPADAARALKCAYLERQRHIETNLGGLLTGDIGGAGMLTMIYANGKGAARNFDLALKFACECDAEEHQVSHARIGHLLKLQAQHWTGNDFSVCDDMEDSVPRGALSTEGLLTCRELQEHFETLALAARLSKITTTWSPQERSALTSLQQAAEAFFNARSENESERGTIHGGVEIYNEINAMDKRAALRNALVTDLEKLEQGQLPKFSSAQFKQTDAELNSAYAAIQKWSDDYDPQDAASTVTREGVKITQRAWIRYRDAWVTFGQVKYPAVSADSWKAWLTTVRVEMWKSWT